MKGVIPKCLCELIIEKFGQEIYDRIMAEAGEDPSRKFLAVEDVEDEKVIQLIETTCKILDITAPQAADAFGDYFVNEFAPKIYYAFYRGASTAREFILKMDTVHEMTTRTMKNAHPPRFDYEWENEETLIMHYKSKRNLIDFLVGLIKGVGNYYGTPLNVTKLDPTRVRIVFPAETTRR